MIVLGNMITAFIQVVIYVLQIRILVSVILSLSSSGINESHPIFVFLNGITEPFCKPFRRILPQNENSGMDCIFAIVTLISVSSLLAGVFGQLSKLI